MRSAIPLKETARGTSFAIRVQPRASSTKITGVHGEGDAAMLKIALAAPPVDGEANEALTRFLANLFSVPRSAVTLLSGAQSRNKVMCIAGKSAAQLQAALEAQ